MIRTLTALVLAVALAACGSTAPRNPDCPGPGGPGCCATAHDCPMQMDGTKVTAADVENGVALDFTTAGDVAELRKRVATRAEVHDQMPCSGNTTPKGGGMGRPQPPASTAAASEIDGGARLVLTPKDPAELARLREFARGCAENMQAGTCPCCRKP